MCASDKSGKDIISCSYIETTVFHYGGITGAFED